MHFGSLQSVRPRQPRRAQQGPRRGSRLAPGRRSPAERAIQRALCWGSASDGSGCDNVRTGHSSCCSKPLGHSRSALARESSAGRVPGSEYASQVKPRRRWARSPTAREAQAQGTSSFGSAIELRERRRWARSGLRQIWPKQSLLQRRLTDSVWTRSLTTAMQGRSGRRSLRYIAILARRDRPQRLPRLVPEFAASGPPSQTVPTRRLPQSRGV